MKQHEGVRLWTTPLAQLDAERAAGSSAPACSALPRTGDKGQRYEHWCDDAAGNPMCMGWSNHPTAGFADAVKHHPAWRNHRSIDRQNAHALAEERSDDSQQRVVGGKVEE